MREEIAERQKVDWLEWRINLNNPRNRREEKNPGVYITYVLCTRVEERRMINARETGEIATERDD